MEYFFKQYVRQNLKGGAVILKVTFRVRENKDDKLFNWLNSLEAGSRSKVIRNILKEQTTKKN